jgi:catechol 1,2-dioxygenase
MTERSRRDFFKQAGAGLAVAGGVLTLRADAWLTPPSGNPELAQIVLAQFGAPPEPAVTRADLRPTRASALGPAYKKGAPFRGKVCPPFEPGTALVVRGRVWGHDTKRPLPGAVLDVWHVDVEGRYAMAGGDYKNRARLLTAEDGAYEFESIHPVAYPMGDGPAYRSPHVHFRVSRPGYRTLITELFFEGDPRHDKDPLFRKELMVPVVRASAHGRAYESATFDVVLESAGA